MKRIKMKDKEMRIAVELLNGFCDISKEPHIKIGYHYNQDTNYWTISNMYCKDAKRFDDKIKYVNFVIKLLRQFEVKI